MTHEEYVSRIGTLTQELTGLAAEYFSAHRDPYEIANERFTQAVHAFEQDFSTRKAELDVRKAAADAAVDAVSLEQEKAQARMVEAIQQGDGAAEQAAAAELDKLALKKQAAVTRADAFKNAQTYGSKSLFNKVVARMRGIVEIKSGGMENERESVRAAIENAIDLLKDQLQKGTPCVNYGRDAENARRCFDAFEKTVGPIDLTARSCAGPKDVKYRIGLSLARKEIAPGLGGTPSETALNSIFEEWENQPVEECEEE